MKITQSYLYFTCSKFGVFSPVYFLSFFFTRCDSKGMLVQALCGAPWP